MPLKILILWELILASNLSKLQWQPTAFFGKDSDALEKNSVGADACIILEFERQPTAFFELAWEVQ